MSGRRAVAIGGGTGLPQVLRAMVDIGLEPTAIVTMADDGGSSGVLRSELGILPPGDVRNCLVALADPAEAELARVFQYRFEGGEGLAGHALGNLMLAALSDLTGDFARAVEIAGKHLRIRGRVLPSTLEDVRLHGVDASGVEVSGQAYLAVSPRPLAGVYLEPDSPAAYAPALDAIRQAEIIVIGPGSLFTSVIPNFLVAGVVEALRESRAHRLYVCNVANMRGETAGFDAADHVDALLRHGLDGALDTVLVHDSGCAPAVVCDDESGVGQVAAGPDAVARIETHGIAVHRAALVDAVSRFTHDHALLTSEFEEVFS